MNVAVVIPAYNEAATLRDVVTRTLAQRLDGNLLQVIVVDDGSRDGTADSIHGLDVILIRHERNLGKGTSLRHGLARALENGADALITLDGDGQHQPEEMRALVAQARQEPGALIVGARCGTARAPFIRRFANGFANFWITLASGRRLPDTQSGYRLYPGPWLQRLGKDLPSSEGFVFESEMLIQAAWDNVPIRFVPITRVALAPMRSSHYCHQDSLRITRMVAGRILWRYLVRPFKRNTLSPSSP